MNEIDRIKKLAGMESKKVINEKVDLTAAAKAGEKLPSARDVPQAMKMAKLKQKVEGEKEGDGVDFKGLFTGIAKGSISIDDKGKIAENNFGIIKDLDEACGKKHKKKMEEESADDSKDEVEESVEIVYEVAPPGEDAESFIKKNKEEFKDRYGDRWEEVLYATAWKQFGEGVEESEMFSNGSLSRYMVEIIIDDLKEGKDIETISEETAFDIKDVSRIVEWFKNRKSTS